MVWSTAEINDEGQKQKSDNRNNLDAGKDEFGFTVDLNGKDIQADNEYNDECDPNSDRDVISPRPVLNNDRGS